MNSPYETPRLLAEYLFFHYASFEEFSGGLPVPQDAWGFPARVVTGLSDPSRPADKALDLGCAVGRSSFELAKFCGSVVGMDFSAAFIGAASTIQSVGEISSEVVLEGERMQAFTARRPEGVDPLRVRFRQGDASALPEGLGAFDLVLAANLLCRLPDPSKLLRRLPSLVSPGGQLLLATPFSWLTEFTPPECWIGGRPDTGTSRDVLQSLLEPHFDLQFTAEMPFLIREHARKFQYGVSLGTRWIRKG